jgi:hypothetical protein
VRGPGESGVVEKPSLDSRDAGVSWTVVEVYCRNLKRSVIHGQPVSAVNCSHLGGTLSTQLTFGGGMLSHVGLVIMRKSGYKTFRSVVMRRSGYRSF